MDCVLSWRDKADHGVDEADIEATDDPGRGVARQGSDRALWAGRAGGECPRVQTGPVRALPGLGLPDRCCLVADLTVIPLGVELEGDEPAVSSERDARAENAADGGDKLPQFDPA